jgi:hypothetical protein
MMFPADRTLLVPDLISTAAPCECLGAHADDLATDPCVARAVAVTAEPGKLPTAVLGLISQQLANGVTREVAAQPDPLHLILDTSNGHRRPA